MVSQPPFDTAVRVVDWLMVSQPEFDMAVSMVTAGTATLTSWWEPLHICTHWRLNVHYTSCTVPGVFCSQSPVSFHLLGGGCELESVTTGSASRPSCILHVHLITFSEVEVLLMVYHIHDWFLCKPFYFLLDIWKGGTTAFYCYCTDFPARYNS